MNTNTVLDENAIVPDLVDIGRRIELFVDPAEDWTGFKTLLERYAYGEELLPEERSVLANVFLLTPQGKNVAFCLPMLPDVSTLLSGLAESSLVYLIEDIGHLMESVDIDKLDQVYVQIIIREAGYHDINTFLLFNYVEHNWMRLRELITSNVYDSLNDSYRYFIDLLYVVYSKAYASMSGYKRYLVESRFNFINPSSPDHIPTMVFLELITCLSIIPLSEMRLGQSRKAAMVNVLNRYADFMGIRDADLGILNQYILTR